VVVAGRWGVAWGQLLTWRPALAECDLVVLTCESPLPPVLPPVLPADAVSFRGLRRARPGAGGYLCRRQPCRERFEGRYGYRWYGWRCATGMAKFQAECDAVWWAGGGVGVRRACGRGRNVVARSRLPNAFGPMGKARLGAWRPTARRQVRAGDSAGRGGVTGPLPGRVGSAWVVGIGRGQMAWRCRAAQQDVGRACGASWLSC